MHLAALNGHSRCIRFLLADYIPSIPDFWILLEKGDHKSIPDFDERYFQLCPSNPLEVILMML